MLDFCSWVAKIRGRSCRHFLVMEQTKGFFAKMMVLAGVDVGEMTLFAREEVKKLVLIEGRIDEEGVKVESQDEEGWGFSDESSLSL